VSLDVGRDQPHSRTMPETMVRVVVLTAGGRPSCPAPIARNSRRRHARCHGRTTPVEKAYSGIQFSKPTIAMIRGYCTGKWAAGAATRASAPRIHGSQYRQPSLAGVPCGLAAAHRCRWAFLAREIFFTARRLDRARVMGLVNRVAPDASSKDMSRTTPNPPPMYR
jgi:enoyl-CoA hydratase/carnithine racemase